MSERRITQYGQRRSGGYWSQPRGTPYDRAWWRFNAMAFSGFLAFLDRRYPHGCLSSHGPYSWAISRRGGRVAITRAGPEDFEDFQRRRSTRGGRLVWIVTGRLVRRHGVSEAFMDAVPVELPRYLHLFPINRCKRGHSLTDPKNIYFVIRQRAGAEHVERRCRVCNRERVKQWRSRH